MSNIKVGVIAGRHPLPVDEYLVTREVTPGDDAYQAAYQAAKEHGEIRDTGSSVDLYYTGLTELTLGALDGYTAAYINVEAYRFDAASGQYFHLPREGYVWKVCPDCVSVRFVRRDWGICPDCNQLYPAKIRVM